MFLSKWREFTSMPCLTGKKNLMTARVPILLKQRALPDSFSISVTSKDLEFGTWTDPSSNNTIDSILHHQEVGQAKDLTAPLIQAGCKRFRRGRSEEGGCSSSDATYRIVETLEYFISKAQKYSVYQVQIETYFRRDYDQSLVNMSYCLPSWILM